MNGRIAIILEMVVGVGFIVAALFYSQLTGLVVNTTPAENEHYGTIIFAVALVVCAVFIWSKFIYIKSKG